MKKQVLVIHGADTFKSYEDYIESLKKEEIDASDLGKKGWKENLQADLGADFQVIAPRMPNKNYAHYNEWKIWFDKYLPVVADGIILVGHSMGAIFLAKYLSENSFPKKIAASFLVAGPYDDEVSESTIGDFAFSTSLENFEKQGGKITFYQSKDDELVPVADFEKYKENVKGANFVLFEDRGHFFQEHFPELVEEIKKLS